MSKQQELMFDKRLVDRLIKRGALSQSEYNTYLANLPDVTNKSEPLVTEDVEPEGSDDGQGDEPAAGSSRT